MKQSLKYSDKALYLKFREYQITYDQFLARVEERRFGTKYVVLDDMKPILNAEYLDKPKDEKIYERYMEILKFNMDKDKREGRLRAQGVTPQEK